MIDFERLPDSTLQALLRFVRDANPEDLRARLTCKRERARRRDRRAEFRASHKNLGGK